MSSHPRLVLDTNVLRDKDFIYWTQSEYHGKLSTSVVSYMELKRQMLHKKPDYDVEAMLRKSRIEILQYTQGMAAWAAEIMNQKDDIQCERCGKIDWADIMIYTSIGNPPTVLVTKNIKDFPDERVMTPDEVMKKFSQRANRSNPEPLPWKEVNDARL